MGALWPPTPAAHQASYYLHLHRRSRTLWFGLRRRGGGLFPISFLWEKYAGVSFTTLPHRTCCSSLWGTHRDTQNHPGRLRVRNLPSRNGAASRIFRWPVCRIPTSGCKIKKYKRKTWEVGRGNKGEGASRPLETSVQ